MIILDESILNTIKRLLGGDIVSDHFNEEILIQINTAFTVLNQLGIGPDNGFVVTSDTQTWADFESDITQHEWIKTYVFLKVKLVFDPPLNSSILDAMKQTIQEYEWRMVTKKETEPKQEDI